MRIGIIGGSGLSDLPGSDLRKKSVPTPFGCIDVSRGFMGGGNEIFFVSRHGVGHALNPSDLNYRGYIFALKSQGVTHVIAITAVGNLRPGWEPGDLVVYDQLVDTTKDRITTFFRKEGGVVVHIGFSEPTCPFVRRLLCEAGECSELPGKVYDGGTLVVMEGPAFSTRAESRRNRQLGGDLIGMTALPEAKLAREAEMHYAGLAVITDHDAGMDGHKAVTNAAVRAVFIRTVDKARAIALQAANNISENDKLCNSDARLRCSHALDEAIMTDPEFVHIAVRNNNHHSGIGLLLQRHLASSRLPKK